MNHAVTSDRLQARLELRRSNAAQPHVNRHRQARKGQGKGGRNSWKRDL
ncbi:hypothetical protein SEA_SKOG_22 [Gordonia phage Skog]|uniref:Uncharacterized protein n=1 Tax=Gordonia phage Skog TaxID=2704033 RepID=A0A6G6XJI0_9CAUD|nr:hypothetical protein KHQ85_gp022 [Gordonia phage Skog]QIG58174.1 hypothetical protein SEA_SKOG_22 [Gordonia phage Skog]